MDEQSAISYQLSAWSEGDVRDFRELAVWQKAHRLVLEVYRSTRTFPPEERYGLTPELKRSAASIPTNIAEGCGREGET